MEAGYRPRLAILLDAVRGAIQRHSLLVGGCGEGCELPGQQRERRGRVGW